MAKSIMVQGTMSNAGKSLFTAGLCRVFKQAGYKVAPFKSQNMALNSYITKEGLEMGRAQVVQAEAAGQEPSVLMNPILLKPTNDQGSQVIVNGEVLGNMNAADYFQYKTKLIPNIMASYQTLDQNNDVIVIEGAGSPAEINLQEDDIVNMGMAKMAKAPVLLVADIDRGGVFASIYGTVMLLSEDERKMIKGIVINKFRGDVEILRPGLRMIEEKVNIPVIGVVPYLNIDIEDEDSLSERIAVDKTVQAVDIAVIRLPRMSNFTDFNVFELIPGVSLRYVKSMAELKNPDMIILPGTKNTMADLLWLRQSGLEAKIKKQAADGETIVFGVCGGYQMLGETLEDPFGVEEGGSLTGMGLLDMKTIFSKQKTRTQVEGRFSQFDGVLAGLSSIRFHGYEIHMGVTETGDVEPLTHIDIESGLQVQKMEGARKLNVMGSYVHGIFDEEGVAVAIAECLLNKKGLDSTSLKRLSYKQYKEQQYDRLADEIRTHVDMAAIVNILEAGV
ncbi:MAG: cobyric acid synthase [Dehalobacter sp. 4CP]|uniref:cobyric acid synthase n=1 Tax=Dehalobacter sp. CP TaxID=2594474 RepID=UPI0013C7CEF0|nr:cobyric acid synthase [Dehalobacter sp. 4CP]